VVVFDRLLNGNRDIWRVDLDGQNLAPVTTDPGDDQDPTVAQGTVVFVSYRSGNGDLWSVPLAGGANTRLTTTLRDETTPALSPDGQRLAYAYLESDVTKLYVANANGTNPQRAAPTFGFDGSIETYPSWAPGNALAFVATNGGTADIFETVGGAAPSLLAGGNTAEVEPAFSADGKTLAFVSNRTGSVEIFLMNVAARTVTQLTSGSGSKSQPGWTPDGRLVYVETVGGTTHLRWIDPADPATSFLIDTGSGTVGHPAATAAP
jgi:TolB protein